MDDISSAWHRFLEDRKQATERHSEGEAYIKLATWVLTTMPDPRMVGIAAVAKERYSRYSENQTDYNWAIMMSSCQCLATAVASIAQPQEKLSKYRLVSEP